MVPGSLQEPPSEKEAGTDTEGRSLTSFGPPGFLLQGSQQGGEHQLHPVSTQVAHHSLGTIICSLKGGEKVFRGLLVQARIKA